MKKIIAVLIIVSVIALSGILIFMVAATANAALDDAKLTNKNRDVLVFDSSGKEISGNSDNYVEFESLPNSLVNAFIAVEDKRFYKHNGLDYVRIAGATLSNIKSRSLSEGASTITCQLIKNTHLSSDKTLKRKLKEAKLALEAERKYDKDEILAMYLNVIYFGNGIYGVGRAARVFFDKEVKSLTLSESASLAAVVVNPSKYSPIIDYEANKSRRATVLRLMLNQGYITEAEYQDAAAKDIDIIGNTSAHHSQSYKENAISEAARLLGVSDVRLLDSELRIYTYFDFSRQQILYSALTNKGLLKPNQNGVNPDTAAMLVNNASGGIDAYYSSTYYLADSLKRQPGSLIKPISVYGAALEKGVILPATPLLDSPEDFGGYSPKNYKDGYYGWTSARIALSNSLNVAAVKVLNYTTIPYAVNYTERLGIKLNGNDRNLSLALGGLTEGVTLQEICGAYMSYANDGLYSKPMFVKKITDKNGKVLYEHKSGKIRVTNQDVAYMITDMLKDTAKAGTAKKLAALRYEIAAKTGTVAAQDGNSDAWCALYTTADTLCVWQGNASMKSSRMLDSSISGGSYPTVMARQILGNLYTSAPQSFAMPPSLQRTAFDAYSLENDHNLLLAGEYTPQAMIHYDLAPQDNTIPVSEYFSVPKVKNFEVTNYGESVDISFDAMPFYSYEVIRTSEQKDTVIAAIENKSGKLNVIDIPPKGIVLYKIIPYFKSETEMIAGQASVVKGILFAKQAKREHYAPKENEFSNLKNVA